MAQDRILMETARTLLTAPDDQRLAYLMEDRWIGYPLAKKALTEMERLLNYPTVIRPPNLLLTTDTNNGKSTIVRRFAALHPVIDDPHAARAERPVVVLDAPSTPDEERFYNHMLHSLGAVYKPSERIDKKLFQLTDLLRKTGLKVLIIDEINNSLAGTGTRRQQLLNAIKELGNTLGRPIILTGTFDALAALRDDKQVQNRFPPFVLPRWQLDVDYLQLVASLEATLPLRRASNLASERLAPLLLLMTDGLIRELSNLLKLAASEAITSGREQITPALLLDLKWLPPSERDKAASAAEAGLAYRFDYRVRLKALGSNPVDEPEEVPGDEQYA